MSEHRIAIDDPVAPSDIADLHAPVMRDRIVELLSPPLDAPHSVYVDVTLGMGGHAEAILAANPTARLVGIDRDPAALALAEQRLDRFADRIDLVHARFDALDDALDDLGIDSVQAILADFGLSSLQIDRPERGFAYRADGPLDMRMDTTQQLTAAEVVNTWEGGDLVRALRDFGDERNATRIVRAIADAREQAPIETSSQLVEIITNSLPAAVRHGGGGHPAKRTFQALRIVVNAELDAVAGFLPAALARLAVGGRLAVLSYHSGEDRQVKQAFADATTDAAPPGLPVVPDHLKAAMRLLTRAAEKPFDAEIETNPRAASARLRAVERTREEAKP